MRSGSGDDEPGERRRLIRLHSLFLGSDVEPGIRRRVLRANEVLVVDLQTEFVEFLADPVEVVAVGADDPEKVAIAGAVAEQVDATVRFYLAIGENPPESRRNTTDDYLDDLQSLCSAPVESQAVEGDTDTAIQQAVAESNLVVASGTQHGLVDRLFDHLPGTRSYRADHGTLLVYGKSSPGWLRGKLEQRLF